MIRKGNFRKKTVDSSTRAMLIRKGNEFFKDGQYQAAENIFVTVDYKDGLVRLADHYLESNDIYKSAEMYFMSENSSLIDAFSEKAARVISKWLAEDSQEDVYDKIIVDSH